MTLYTQAIESLAHSDAIPVADAHARFIAEHRDDPKAPLFLQNDAWHPTPRVHGLIADCVLPLVVPAKK